jgi:hypothetical protein
MACTAPAKALFVLHQTINVLAVVVVSETGSSPSLHATPRTTVQGRSGANRVLVRLHTLLLESLHWPQFETLLWDIYHKIEIQCFSMTAYSFLGTIENINH